MHRPLMPRGLAPFRRATLPSLGLLVLLGAAACTVAPPPGTPVPPRVDVLVGDTRGAQYGSTAQEILAHPAVRDEVPQLFGADWTARPPVRTSVPAAEFFGKSVPPRVLRIAGSDYVAVPGCAAAACQARRGLLLVRVDGGLFYGRLDEGGFSHYYVRGVSLDTTPRNHALLDAAWAAVEGFR